MEVTIIPIVIGALGTVTKGLLKRLEDLEITERVETIQTTALLRSARILSRGVETWGELLSLKLRWKTISLRKSEILGRIGLVYLFNGISTFVGYLMSKLFS